MCLNYCTFSCKTNLNRCCVIYLAVFSILWILSDCRVIRMADSMRGHDQSWWRNSPRQNDFNWNSTFKSKPIDQGNVHAKNDSQVKDTPNSNAQSFDRSALTLQRYDWWWMTTSTTEAPYNFDNIGGGSGIDGLALFFILFPVIAGAIFVVCKYHLCEDRSCTTILCRELCDEPSPEEPHTSRSSRNNNRRAPRPTSFVNHSFSAEANSSPGGRSSSRPQISLALSGNEDRFSSSSVTGGSRAAQNNTRTSDKPPGYSDVILADFSEGPTRFPEVNPTMPGSPPPLYDEGNMKY